MPKRPFSIRPMQKALRNVYLCHIAYVLLILMGRKRVPLSAETLGQALTIERYAVELTVIYKALAILRSHALVRLKPYNTQREADAALAHVSAISARLQENRGRHNGAPATFIRFQLTAKGVHAAAWLRSNTRGLREYLTG